jgi:hypothetical protein
VLSRIIFMPLSDNPTTPAAICLGGESDYVDIRLNEGYLAITAVGAPTGSCFYNGVLQGFEQGWIRPGMPTLVDARQFRGNVDWAAMLAISRITDWGKGGTVAAPVAYITGDALFSLLVKAASTMFPDSRHRLFPDPESARHWLIAQAVAQA